MSKQIEVEGKCQYDSDIKAAYRASACGPVTAFVLLRHLFPDRQAPQVNDLYRLLGGTRIGLPAWRFIRNMRKVLGSGWTVQKCTVTEAVEQIDNGLPVAVKFDKWTSLNWRRRFSFDYHWVVMTGYEMVGGALYLHVHDHGGRNRKSQVRRIPYLPNEKVLTFIKLEPSERRQ